MKHATSLDTVWSSVRNSPDMPFVLQIRLTDDAKIFGGILVSNLKTPGFTKEADPAQNSLHQSFAHLRTM